MAEYSKKFLSTMCSPSESEKEIPNLLKINIDTIVSIEEKGNDSFLIKTLDGSTYEGWGFLKYPAEFKDAL